MDKLIFYKEEGLDREKIKSIRFSYQRDFEAHIFSKSTELISFVKTYPNCLVYYFTNQLTTKDRILISTLKLNYKDLNITLCTNKSHALDAWKLRVFDFIEHPVDNLKLINSYKNYISIDTDLNSEFVLKTKEGIRKISYRYINYFKANGNYTSINLIKDKSILQTKQLQKYEHVTESAPQFHRVHRSLILNLKNVKEVGGKVIKFYQTDKALDISKSLEVKIKQILLGK